MMEEVAAVSTRRMPSPRQVEAFEAVVRLGTTTAAAQQLRTSQPAISRMIRDFEATLSLKLFRRNGNRLVPTLDGLVLFREAQRCFDGFRALSECAERIRHGVIGGLRIAAMPALAARYLSAPVAELLESNPGLSISIHCELSQNLPAMIASGQFDLAIGSLPLHGPSVALEPLPMLSASCALPSEHPLAREKIIDLRALRRVPMVSHGANSMLRIRLAMAMACVGVQPDIRVEATTGVTLCGLVQRGVGIAIVDPFTALECSERQLAVRPVQPDIPYEASMLFPQRGPRPAAVNSFVAALKRNIRKDFGVPWA